MRNDLKIVYEALKNNYQKYAPEIEKNLVGAAEESVDTSLSYINAVALTHPERLHMSKEQVKENPHKAYTTYLGLDTIETALKMYDKALNNGKSTENALKQAFDYTTDTFQDLIKYNQGTDDEKARFTGRLQSLAGTYDSQGGVYVVGNNSLGGQFIQNSIDLDVDLPGNFLAGLSTLTQPSLIGKWVGDAITNLAYGAGPLDTQVGASVRNAIEESFSQNAKFLNAGGNFTLFGRAAKPVYNDGVHNALNVLGMGVMMGEAIAVSAITKSPAVLKYYMVANSAVSDLREETGLSRRYVYGNKNQDINLMPFIASRIFDAETISLSNMLSPLVAGTVTSGNITNTISQKSSMIMNAMLQTNIDVMFDTALDFTAHNVLATTGTEFTVGQQRQLGLFKNDLGGGPWYNKVGREIMFRAANRYGSQLMKSYNSSSNNPYRNAKYWQSNWGMGKISSKITALSSRFFGQEVGEIPRFIDESPALRNQLTEHLQRIKPDIDLHNKDIYTELVRHKALDRHAFFMLYMAKEKATNAYFQGMFDKTTGKLTNWRSFKDTFVMNDPVMQPLARGIYKATGVLDVGKNTEAFEQRIIDLDDKGSVVVRNNLFGNRTTQELGVIGVLDMAIDNKATKNDIYKIVRGISSLIKQGGTSAERIQISQKLGQLIFKEFPGMFNEFITKSDKGNESISQNLALAMKEGFMREFPDTDYDESEAQSHANNFGFVTNKADINFKPGEVSDIEFNTKDIIDLVNVIRTELGRDNESLKLTYNKLGVDELVTLAGAKAVKFEEEQVNVLKQIIQAEKDFENQNIFRKILIKSNKNIDSRLLFDLNNEIIKKVDQMKGQVNDEGSTLIGFRAEYLRALGGYTNDKGEHMKGLSEEIIDGLIGLRENTKLTDDQKVERALKGLIELSEILKTVGYRLPDGIAAKIKNEMTAWEELDRNASKSLISSFFEKALGKDNILEYAKYARLEEDSSTLASVIHMLDNAGLETKIGINRLASLVVEDRKAPDYKNIMDLFKNDSGITQSSMLRNIIATGANTFAGYLPDDIMLIINGVEVDDYMRNTLDLQVTNFKGKKPDDSIMARLMGISLIKRYNIFRYSGDDHETAQNKLKRILTNDGIKFNEDTFEVREDGLEVKFIPLSERLSENAYSFISETKQMASVFLDKYSYNKQNWGTFIENIGQKDIMVTYGKNVLSITETLDKMSKEAINLLDVKRNLNAIVGLVDSADQAKNGIEEYLNLYVPSWKMIPERQRGEIVNAVVYQAITDKAVNHSVNIVMQQMSTFTKDTVSHSNISSLNFISGTNRMNTIEIETNNLDKKQYRRFKNLLEEQGVFALGKYGANSSVKYLHIRELAGLKNNHQKRAKVISEIIREQFNSEINKEANLPEELRFYTKAFETIDKDLASLSTHAYERKGFSKRLADMLNRIYNIELQNYDKHSQLDLDLKNISKAPQKEIVKVFNIFDNFGTLLNNGLNVLEGINQTESDIEVEKLKVEFKNLAQKIVDLKDADDSRISKYIQDGEKIQQEIIDIQETSKMIDSAKDIRNMFLGIIETNIRNIQNSFSTLYENIDNVPDELKQVRDIYYYVKSINAEIDNILNSTGVKFTEQRQVLSDKLAKLDAMKNDEQKVLREWFKFIHLGRESFVLDAKGYSKRAGAISVAGASVDRKNNLLPRLDNKIDEIYDSDNSKVKLYITNRPKVAGAGAGDGAIGIPTWVKTFFDSFYYGQGGQKISIGNNNLLIKGYGASLMNELGKDGKSLHEYMVFNPRTNEMERNFRFDDNTIVIDIENFKVLPATLWLELGLSETEIKKMYISMAGQNSYPNQERSERSLDGMVFEFDRNTAKNLVKHFNSHAEYPTKADQRKYMTQQVISDHDTNNLFNSVVNEMSYRFDSVFSGLNYNHNTGQFRHQLQARIKNTLMQKNAIYTALIPFQNNNENHYRGRYWLMDEGNVRNYLNQKITDMYGAVDSNYLKQLIDTDGVIVEPQIVNKTVIDYNVLLSLFKGYINQNTGVLEHRTIDDMLVVLKKASGYYNKTEFNDTEFAGYQETVGKMLDYLSDNKHGVLIKDNVNGEDIYHIMMARSPILNKGQLAHQIIKGIASPGSHNGMEMTQTFITKESGGDFDGDGVLQNAISRNSIEKYYNDKQENSVRDFGLTALFYKDSIDAMVKKTGTGTHELTYIGKVSDADSEDIPDDQTRVGQVMNAIKIASALLSRLRGSSLKIGDIEVDGKVVNPDDYILEQLKKHIQGQEISVNNFKDMSIYNIIKNVALDDENSSRFVIYDMEGEDTSKAKFYGSLKHEHLTERSINDYKYTFLSVPVMKNGEAANDIVLLRNEKGSWRTEIIGKYSYKLESGFTADILRTAADSFMNKRSTSNASQDFNNLIKSIDGIEIKDVNRIPNSKVAINMFAESQDRFTGSLANASVNEGKDHGLTLVSKSFSNNDDRGYSNNLAQFLVKLSVSSQFNIDRIDEINGNTIFKTDLFKRTGTEVDAKETQDKIVNKLNSMVSNTISDLLINGKYSDFPSLREINIILSRHKGNLPKDDSYSEYLNLLDKYVHLVEGDRANYMTRNMDADLYQALKSYSLAKDNLNRIKAKMPSEVKVSAEVSKELGDIDHFKTNNGMYDNDIIDHTHRLFVMINQLSGSGAYSTDRNLEAYFRMINKQPILWDIKNGVGQDPNDFHSPRTLAHTLYKMQDSMNAVDFLSYDEITKYIKDLNIKFSESESKYPLSVLKAVYKDLANDDSADIKAAFQRYEQLRSEDAPYKVFKTMMNGDKKAYTVNDLITNLEKLKRSNVGVNELGKISKLSGMLISLLPDMFQEYAITRSFGITDQFRKVISKDGKLDITDESGNFQIRTKDQYDAIMEYFHKRNNKLNIVNEEYISNKAIRSWDMTKNLIDSEMRCY